MQLRPGGFRPGDPCPDLLTQEEAIRYLRLDTIEIRNPGETLDRYRKQGVLRGTHGQQAGLLPAARAGRVPQGRSTDAKPR